MAARELGGKDVSGVISKFDEAAPPKGAMKVWCAVQDCCRTT
jgi:hypothetical protein